jgi:hypothetical protein
MEVEDVACVENRKSKSPQSPHIISASASTARPKDSRRARRGVEYGRIFNQKRNGKFLAAGCDASPGPSTASTAWMVGPSLAFVSLSEHKGYETRKTTETSNCEVTRSLRG